ncbi:transporter [Methylomonas sp. AM2-LC]|uniref:SphA family protein n=1 Tax=Methylomonas sp. AM2-LC TaxID=3153301 RepID=UPI0032662623
MKPLIFIFFIFELISPCAVAIEDGAGNYLPGFYGDFQMASLPKRSGFYLNNLFSAYQDNQASTGNLLEMPGIIYVSDKTLLGATLASGLWPTVQISKAKDGGNSQSRLGLGDPYLMPVLLSRDWDTIKLQGFEGIVAPLGYYNKDQLSTGCNIWTFDHNLAVTFMLPSDNELSVDVGYMQNTQNTATHYKNGDELHIDYLLGHYFQSDFALGITGSYYRQVTADQAPAQSLANVFNRADTIGPAVMYTPPLGKRNINMSLKWLHEFNVQGHIPQDYILWRVDSPF